MAYNYRVYNNNANDDNHLEFIGFVGIETIYTKYNKTFVSKTKLYKYLRARYIKIIPYKPSFSNILFNKVLVTDESIKILTSKDNNSAINYYWRVIKSKVLVVELGLGFYFRP